MSFTPSADEERLAGDIRRIARERLLPVVAGGVRGRVNRVLVRALGDQRILAKMFPVEVGGELTGGVSALRLCLLREALARESPEVETALAMQGLGGYPILQAGTEPVVRRWGPRIAGGDAVAAFALTEPGHGSDAGAIELTAEPEGEGWRLNGTKTWISNAPHADIYVLFARTEAGAGARGVTAFALPGHTRGLTGRPLEVISDHPIGTLDLQDVRLPADHVLGEVNGGFRVAMRTLDLFRPSVGAFAVGMGQAALDVAVAHAAERRAFGRPIREFQAVSHSLAEMATRLEAARLMVRAAALAHDEGAPDVTRRSAMAKLFATETAQWVVDRAVQILGARALERGHLLERLYRDVRAPRIYEGTSEIQREIIAHQLYR